MEFNWYNLFKKQEFLDTGLVSKKLTVTLEGIGEKEILITKGNETSILYDGVFLPINFTDKNPFTKDGYAVWEDANGIVWLGVEIES